MDYDPTNYLPEIKAAQTIPDPSVSYAMKLIERVSQLEAALREKDALLQQVLTRNAELGFDIRQAREENSEYERKFSQREAHWIRENARIQGELQQAREEIEQLKRLMADVDDLVTAPMKAERDTFRAQVERLSAPVTDEEWYTNHRRPDLDAGYRAEFNAILASRLRKVSHEEKI